MSIFSKFRLRKQPELAPLGIEPTGFSDGAAVQDKAGPEATQAPQKPKRIKHAAKHGLIVRSADGQIMLAFGLSWTPEISDARSTTLAAMHKAKSTHMLRDQGVTGHVRLVGLAKGQSQTIYAGAIVAAQHLGAEDGVFALTLPNGFVWVTTLSAGVPMSEQILDIDAALGLAQHWVGTVFTDLELPSETIGSLNTQPYQLADLLALSPTSRARLTAVPRKKALSSVPRPVLWAMGAMLTYLAVDFAFEQYETQTRQATQMRNAAERAQQQAEAQSAWHNIIKREMSTKSQQIDLTALHQGISRLPVLWQGWPMEAATCESSVPSTAPGALAAPQNLKTWNCVAMYNAPDSKLGPRVTPNRELIVPQGMTVEFLPTKRVSLRWQVQTPTQPLNLTDLITRHDHAVGTASLLQSNAPQLTSLPDIVFSAWRIDAPKVDGIAAPMPQNLVIPLSAPITIRGNLPAVQRLQPQIRADWQKVRLTTTQDQIGIDVEFSGVLYAKAN